MNKNTKLLMGASSLAVLAMSAFTLQGCDNGGDDTAAAAGSGGAAAGSPSVGGAKATAGSGGLVGTAGRSSGGAGGVAGVGGAAAGAGGVTGGAAGSSGAAGNAAAGGAAGAAGAGAGGGAGASGAASGGGGAGGAAGSAGTAGTAGSAGTAGTAGSGGATATTFTLQTAGAVGQVLATANGHTLYVHKGDTASTTAPASTCAGGCLTAWPVYYGNPVSVPSGVSASDIHSFTNGAAMQSTYMGWPLYTYTGDTAAGTATGNSVSGPWYAVKIPFTPPT